jgi:hypothetical protein
MRPAPPRVRQLEDRLTPSFTYYGGPLLGAVQVQGVYLGSDWANAATSYPGQVTQFEGYLNSVVNSSFMDMLRNEGYNVGRGTDAPGQVLNLNLPQQGTSASLSDGVIQSDLQQAITNGTLVQPDGNSGGVLYMAFVEDGVVVSQGGGNSRNTFYAYHNYFAGIDSSGNAADVYYAVMPYQGTNGNAAVGGLSKTNGMMMVGSHELAEGVTDPQPGNGWYDNANGEVGDVVNGEFVKLGNYPVQRISDVNDWPMTPAGATDMYKVSFSVTNGTLYKKDHAGTFALATGVAGISAQTVDNTGQAMIDVRYTNGSAAEYHEQGNQSKAGRFISLASSAVVDAQAGQASSWYLLSDGTVDQYIDSSWNNSAYRQTVASGVSSMVAGLGSNGVNQVTLTLTSGAVAVYNDSTGMGTAAPAGGGSNASRIAQEGTTDGRTGRTRADRAVLPPAPVVTGASEAESSGPVVTLLGADVAPSGDGHTSGDRAAAGLLAGLVEGDLVSLLHGRQAPGADWNALLNTTIGDELPLSDCV